MSAISIKWKILSLALLGPIILAGILAWQRINDIHSGAEAAIISKSAGIVLMAEATRDQMAKKLLSGVITPFDQLTSVNILDAVPVVTAMQVADAPVALRLKQMPSILPKWLNN